MAHVIPDSPPSPKMLKEYVKILAKHGPDSTRVREVRDREADHETLFDMLDDIADSLRPGVEKVRALLKFLRSLGYKVA